MRLPLTATFVRAVGSRDPLPTRGAAAEPTRVRARAPRIAGAPRRLMDRDFPAPSPLDGQAHAPAGRRDTSGGPTRRVRRRTVTTVPWRPANRA